MTKAIIALAKDKLITSLVTPYAKEPIKETNEYGWALDTLDLTFLEIAKHTSERRWRILVGEDLSYVVRLTIPVAFKDNDERDAVLDQLSEKIPEELSQSQWDYKEVGIVDGETGEKRKDILAFALVHDLLPAITKAAKKANLYIEAIEPEVVARTRNANPLIGLALKEDLSGDDKNILNIRPTIEIATPKEEEVETYVEKPQPSVTLPKNRRTLILSIILVILLLIAAFIYRNTLIGLFKNNKTTNVVPPAITTPSISIMPTVTSVISPTPSITNLSKLKLKVENGTSVNGAASAVKELLLDNGFTDIETANADNKLYEDTEVILPTNSDEIIFNTIKATLSDYSVVKAKSILSPATGYDVIIIVGKKK